MDASWMHYHCVQVGYSVVYSCDLLPVHLPITGMVMSGALAQSRDSNDAHMVYGLSYACRWGHKCAFEVILFMSQKYGVFWHKTSLVWKDYHWHTD